MTDEVTELDGEYSPCERPPIRIHVIDRDRNGRRWSLVLEDGPRKYTALLDIRDAKKRMELIRDLKQRWPDLNDDGHRADALLSDLEALAADALRPLPSESTPPADLEVESPRYFADERGMFWRKSTRDGDSDVQLTNFSARVVTEITLVDGVQKQKKFELEITLGSVIERVTVSIEEFHQMNWHLAALGAAACIMAGSAVKDHARVAIQTLSQGIERKTVYRHLGWTTIDGRPVYLHAQGGLGAPNVQVEIVPALASFVLPPPPSGNRRIETIRASMAFLDVAPKEVTIPIFAAIYRSVFLVPTDFALWIHGRSGSQKSELAALAQQHFGPAMDRTHLPGCFVSSGNFNELVAFFAKNTLLVIDDYAPQAGNAQKLRAEAERLFRSQGNRSGRGRMTQSAQLTTSKPPRGLMLATAEDLPHGYSLRSRLFMVAMNRGDVNLERLTALQADAARGLFAEAMSAFIEWIAPRLGSLESVLIEDTKYTRGVLRKNGHARNPDQIAHLMFGFDRFLEFAHEVGALPLREATPLRRVAWRSLVMVGREQASLLVSEEPALQFVRLLIAVIDSGEGKLRPWPQSSQDSQDLGDETSVCSEKHIGWRDEDGIYLDFELGFAAVQRLARSQGSELPNSPITIKRRLYEMDFLAQVDRSADGTIHYEVKKTIATRTKRRVLHLVADLGGRLEKLGTLGILGTDDIPEPPPSPLFDRPETDVGTTEFASEGKMSVCGSECVSDRIDPLPADAKPEPSEPENPREIADFGIEDPEANQSSSDDDDANGVTL